MWLVYPAGTFMLRLSIALFLVGASCAAAQAPAPAAIHDEPLSVPAVVYPADARQARTEGTVQLQVNVDATGHVTSVDALSGPVALRQAAIDAYMQATYPPLIVAGHASSAIVTTAVNFSLKELPPDTDQLVDKQFEPLHARCQQLSLDKSADAMGVCQQAVNMSERFTPQAQLEVRATALNDLVLLLIVDGKKSKELPEAGVYADRAVALVSASGKSLPHTPAVAIAFITRAEVRSLAGNLKGSAADCAEAEEVLTTLLADQAKDVKENDRSGNLRVQLRDTYLLHAIVLERDGKKKDAAKMRVRAGDI
jgi:TonB family protein